VKLAPQSAAVLRQNAGPLLPAGVVPLAKITNDRIQGDVNEQDLTQSTIQGIFCSADQGYQWCYCPKDKTHDAGYACCTDQHCGFKNGYCQCSSDP
jgi:hypothetical protein